MSFTAVDRLLDFKLVSFPPPMYVANEDGENIMLETDSTVVNKVCKVVIYKRIGG